jgi:Replication initiator protein A C-terminal domain
VQGWVKLHRRILESSTFLRLDSKQKLIAIYLILNANHKDNFWFDKYIGERVLVLRGQLVTSRSIIVNDWFKKDKAITEQVVRTTLSKLEKLNFLTKQSTNKYTLITIEKYDIYQSDSLINPQLSNQRLTSDKPGVNLALTTNNNVKNDNNLDKEETYIDTAEEYINTPFIDLEQSNKDVEIDKHLKESLKDSLPPLTFKILDLFCCYEEMTKLIGIIYRAKKRVEDKRQDLLQIEYLDREISQTLLKCFRKTKREFRVENNENYIYKSLYNLFENISKEIKTFMEKEKIL